MLGISTKRIVLYNPCTLYKSEKLYWVKGIGWLPSRETMTNIRGLFVNPQLKLIKPYIVIIDRLDKYETHSHTTLQNQRQITNLPEIEKALELSFPHMTVRRIRNSDYNLEAQIDIFSKAEIIVGVLGAGLANVQYAKKEATVIEIIPAGVDISNGMSHQIPSSCGFTYTWHIAEAVGLEYYAYLLPEYGWNDEIHIPTENFVQFLDYIK